MVFIMCQLDCIFNESFGFRGWIYCIADCVIAVGNAAMHAGWQCPSMDSMCSCVHFQMKVTGICIPRRYRYQRNFTDADIQMVGLLGQCLFAYGIFSSAVHQVLMTVLSVILLEPATSSWIIIWAFLYSIILSFMLAHANPLVFYQLWQQYSNRLAVWTWSQILHQTVFNQKQFWDMLGICNFRKVCNKLI